MTVSTYWPQQIPYMAKRGTWSLVSNGPVLRTDMDYGRARSRRRFTKQLAQITFTIQMTDEEHLYFEGFFHTEIQSGSSWFYMPVYLGKGGYETRMVRFLGPYEVRDAGFMNVEVVAKLEVEVAPVISGGALYFIETYGEPSLDSWLDILSRVVNVKYPAAMEDF